MLIQSATTIQRDAQVIGALNSPSGASLFAGCAELVGVSMCYGRDEEIYGEGEDAEFVYMVAAGAVRTICCWLSHNSFSGLKAEAALFTSWMSNAAIISARVKTSWSPCDQPRRTR